MAGPSERVRDRGARPEEPTPPVAAPEPAKLATPVNWWKLDVEERAETLEVLQKWVPQLVRSYGLKDSVVPPCWWKHEALVQELLALFQYRNQQQVLPVSPPSAMLDFHYQFDIARRRLAEWTGMTGCNSAEHFETSQQMWVVPGTVQRSQWEVEFDEHIDQVRHEEEED